MSLREIKNDEGTHKPCVPSLQPHLEKSGYRVPSLVLAYELEREKVQEGQGWWRAGDALEKGQWEESFWVVDSRELLTKKVWSSVRLWSALINPKCSYTKFTACGKFYSSDKHEEEKLLLTLFTRVSFRTEQGSSCDGTTVGRIKRRACHSCGRCLCHGARVSVWTFQGVLEPFWWGVIKLDWQDLGKVVDLELLQMC